MKFLIFVLSLFFISCGASDDEVIAENSETIVFSSARTIANPDIFTFSENVITVINHDDIPHTITSQSAPGAFDDNGEFDVLIPANGKNNFQLPQAADGTVFYYYCRLHFEADEPGSGTITIE